MELRPYQQDLVNKIRQAICSGSSRVCAVLGCGGGKSVIIATIAKAATDKGNRVLFLVHRKELTAQISRTMNAMGSGFLPVQSGYGANHGQAENISKDHPTSAHYRR